MKRPLGCACLFFILFIRLFYVCFPPSLPEYDSMHGREVYISGQVISIKQQELYGEPQTVYTLAGVALKESSAVLYDAYLSDKSSAAYNTKEENLNIGDAFRYDHDRIYCFAEKEYEGVYVGSWVWMQGTFEPFDAARNPGQFDSRFYYHMQGAGANITEARLVWTDGGKKVLQENLRLFKAFLAEKIDSRFSERYGGVMKTILLGDKSGLDKDLKTLFQEGGILHILTISGLHISMLGMGSFRLLRKFGAPQKFSAAIGLTVVLLYGALIGTQTATFRAICMFLLQMLAVFMGRTYDRMTGLSLAAVLLLLEQPLYVFYSGFLLSFGAVLGVTVIPPVVDKVCENRGQLVKWLVRQFSGGIGILMATFPIQLYFYYEYPIYSMFINVLVLPLLPYIVGLGLAVLAVPQAVYVVAVPFVFGSERMLWLYEWICEMSRRLPHHSLVLGAPKGWQIVVYYGCLSMWLGWMEFGFGNRYRSEYTWKVVGWIRGLFGATCQKKRLNMSSLAVPFYAFIFSVILLLWRPVEGLTCHFLSVGQGDCAVLQYGTETYVVDCGSTSNSGAGMQILLPCLKYLGVPKVDGVFISHADADHMNGIVQWLEEYEHSHVELGSIILPSLTEEALAVEFGELMTAAEIWGIPVVTLGAGDRLELGALTIDVLHPVPEHADTLDANGYSQVVLFQYAGQGILMTGDIGEEQERELCKVVKQQFVGNNAKKDRSTVLGKAGPWTLAVLKAPHHGSKYSSSSEFLTACNPENIILSYGVGNRYGHPHREAVERMQETDAALWYTGRQGAIRCVVTKYGVEIEGVGYGFF